MCLSTVFLMTHLYLSLFILFYYLLELLGRRILVEFQVEIFACTISILRKKVWFKQEVLKLSEPVMV